jgi:hypothetical protein
MNKELQNKIVEYIDILAQKLGVASEFVFTTLVRQKFAEGITYTGIYFLGILILLFVFKESFKQMKMYKKEHYLDTNPYAIVSAISGGLGGVWVIVGMILVSTEVMKIFNPEYYAIKELLGVFK